MIKSIKHARADKTKFKFTVDLKKLTNLPSDLIGNVIQLHWSRGDHKGESKGYRVQKKTLSSSSLSSVPSTPQEKRKSTEIDALSNFTTPSATPVSTTTNTPLSTTITTSAGSSSSISASFQMNLPQSNQSSATTTPSSSDPILQNPTQTSPPTPAVEVNKETTLNRKQAKMLLGDCITGDNNLPSGNGHVVMNEKMAIPVTLYSQSSHQEHPAPFEQKLLNISLLLGQLTIATLSIDLALHYLDHGREVISIPFPSSSSTQPTLMLSLKAKCKDKDKKNILVRSKSNNGAGNNMLNPHYQPTTISASTTTTTTAPNINNNNNNNNNNVNSDSSNNNNNNMLPNITISNTTGNTTSLHEADPNTSFGGGALVRDATTESLATSTWSDDDSTDDTFHVNEKELAQKTMEIRSLTSKLIQYEAQIQESNKMIEHKDRDLLIMIKKVEQAQTAVLEYEETAHRAKVMEEYATRKMIKLNSDLEKQKKIQRFSAEHHLPPSTVAATAAAVMGHGSAETSSTSPNQQVIEYIEMNEKKETMLKEKDEELKKKDVVLESLNSTIQELKEQLENKNKEIEQVIEGSKQYFETQLSRKEEKIAKLKESLENIIRESNHKDIELIEKQKQEDRIRQANPSPKPSFYQSLLYNPLVAWSVAIFFLMMFYLKSQDC